MLVLSILCIVPANAIEIESLNQFNINNATENSLNDNKTVLNDDNIVNNTNYRSDCHIKINPVVCTKGENVSLNATLLDRNGQGVSGQQISFFDSNGYLIGEGKTNENGEANCNYIILQKPDKYTIKVTYNGSSQYYPTNSITTLLVNRWNEKIHVDDITCKYGDVVPITIKLTNATNKAPIIDKMVNIRLSNGTFINQGKTDSNGQFTYNYTVLNKPGENEMEATTNMDSEYNYAIYFFKLNVEKPNPKILLNDVTCTRGNMYTLTAKLSNQEDKPLSGEMVTFYQNGMKIGENTTNSDGKASYSYECDVIGGYYPTTAQYDGNDYYSPLNATSQLHVYNWKTVLTIDNMTAKPGGIVTVTAKLTKAITGEPLINKEIGFNDFNSEYIGSNITNNDGEAQIQYQVPNQTKIYRISAHFNAEKEYSCSDIASYIIVTNNDSTSKLNTSITDNFETLKYLEILQLNPNFFTIQDF